MNQKDYKEIARIIKGYFTWHTFGTDWVDTWRSQFANELADYFEREDKFNRITQAGDFEGKKFNKEQFIKWCGVK